MNFSDSFSCIFASCAVVTSEFHCCVINKDNLDLNFKELVLTFHSKSLNSILCLSSHHSRFELIIQATVDCFTDLRSLVLEPDLNHTYAEACLCSQGLPHLQVTAQSHSSAIIICACMSDGYYVIRHTMLIIRKVYTAL